MMAILELLENREIASWIMGNDITELRQLAQLGDWHDVAAVLEEMERVKYQLMPGRHSLRTGHVLLVSRSLAEITSLVTDGKTP